MALLLVLDSGVVGLALSDFINTSYFRLVVWSRCGVSRCTLQFPEEYNP